jgi:ribosome assembly protein YihI (activator of Der GTPase)
MVHAVAQRLQVYPFQVKLLQENGKWYALVEDDVFSILSAMTPEAALDWFEKDESLLPMLEAFIQSLADQNLLSLSHTENKYVDLYLNMKRISTVLRDFQVAYTEVDEHRVSVHYPIHISHCRCYITTVFDYENID